MTELRPDEMTPKERAAAVVAGQPFDRIPCNLFMGEHAARLIDAKVSELHLDVEKMVAAQLATVETYESEGLSVSVGLTGFAETLGSTVAFPDHGTPYIKDFGLKTEEDLDRIARPDPARSGRFPLVLRAAELLVKEVGDRIPVTVGTIGPLSTAGNLRGVDRLMREMRTHPEFVHRLLRVVTDATIDFVKEAAKREVQISVGDPTASGSLISPEHFRIFALPYLQELVSAIVAATGSAPVLHICGDTRKIWREMADTCARSLSIDDCVDLAEAKQAVGDRVTLVGNIRPTGTMYLGKPEDVEANAKECLRKAYDSPKGYVLALGCGLPYATPPENIHALVRSARRFGRYPLHPDNFT
jgi:uroporphyrinogen decarboxylase